MDSRWYLSLELSERKQVCNSPCSPSEKGHQRLRKWKNSPAFTDGVFEKYLAHENINESLLLQILSDEPEILKTQWREPLPFILKFQELIQSSESSLPGFLGGVAPLLRSYGERLVKKIEALKQVNPNLKIDIPGVLGSLLSPIQTRLLRMIQRSMILEINILRIEEKLTKGTPEERYTEFLKLLETPEFRRQIFQEYPVLARKCIEALDLWLSFSEEFLERLTKDYSVLTQEFLEGTSASISKIRGGIGDTHQRGRSVLMVDFDNGKSVVYKPRNLKSDASFQNLVTWLNQKGQTPPLKTYQVLCQGEYGWVEHIPFKECETPEEVERFYERQGAWLSVLYAVSATDLHLENLIASGEHPVIIDLETLFHPRTYSPPTKNAEDLAREKMGDSVMTIGLLPIPQRVKGKAFDTSGLGASANQEAPYQVDGIEGVGTDEIRIAKIAGKIGQIQSRPGIQGEASPIDCAAIERGFKRTYLLLAEHKKELLSEQGPLQEFKKAPIRAVLRPSAFYASLLHESFHPKLLRNGLDRDLFFNQVWEEVKRRDHFLEVASSEKRQMLFGDIPYFKTYPESFDITGGDGVHLKGVLKQDGWSGAVQRIQRMSEQDLQDQTWFVRASLTSLGVENLPTKPTATKFSDLLSVARTAGDTLLNSALIKDTTASWVTLRYQGNDESPKEGHFQIAIADNDLYAGLAGVSLFTAYLAHLTQSQSYRGLSEKCLNQIRESLSFHKGKMSLGVFSGAAGFIYLFQHLAFLWNQPELLDEAEDLLAEIESRISHDMALDVIAGSAGTIPVLCGLARVRPMSRAKEIATLCGERLLSIAEKSEEGLVWPMLRLLRGLSHGHSGIAMALSDLAKLTGEERFHKASLQAIRFERKLIGENYWTDIPENPLGGTWCHGSHGIAMARMRMWENFPDTEVKEQLDWALETAVSKPNLFDHSLCHGVTGNLEVFVMAAKLFPENEKYRNELAVRKKALLQDISQRGWGTPLAPDLVQPSLMIGVSGIGYGCLLLTYPDEVPSVLTLRTPAV